MAVDDKELPVLPFQQRLLGALESEGGRKRIVVWNGWFGKTATNRLLAEHVEEFKKRSNDNKEENMRNKKTDFSSQLEILQYVIGGGTVCRIDLHPTKLYRVIGNQLLVGRPGARDIDWVPTECNFQRYISFSRYELPEWWEELRAHQILCWVSDTSSTEKAIATIIYDRIGKEISGDARFITKGGSEWVYATPLTESDRINYFYKGKS